MGSSIYQLPNSYLSLLEMCVRSRIECINFRIRIGIKPYVYNCVPSTLLPKSLAAELTRLGTRSRDAE